MKENKCKMCGQQILLDIGGEGYWDSINENIFCSKECRKIFLLNNIAAAITGLTEEIYNLKQLLSDKFNGYI